LETPIIYVDKTLFREALKYFPLITIGPKNKVVIKPHGALPWLSGEPITIVTEEICADFKSAAVASIVFGFVILY